MCSPRLHFSFTAPHSKVETFCCHQRVKINEEIKRNEKGVETANCSTECYLFCTTGGLVMEPSRACLPGRCSSPHYLDESNLVSQDLPLVKKFSLKEISFPWMRACTRLKPDPAPTCASRSTPRPPARLRGEQARGTSTTRFVMLNFHGPNARRRPCHRVCLQTQSGGRTRVCDRSMNELTTSHSNSSCVHKSLTQYWGYLGVKPSLDARGMT